MIRAGKTLYLEAFTIGLCRSLESSTSYISRYHESIIMMILSSLSL